KGVLWSPSCLGGSCGAPVEIVRQYIEEHRSKY
ncbi:IS200/IS605 family transposase, partial [Roseibium sp. RKSG952]|nr:IS200/IS605 family transposase [Roseibium sp. RKSG952]